MGLWYLIITFVIVIAIVDAIVQAIKKPKYKNQYQDQKPKKAIEQKKSQPKKTEQINIIKILNIALFAAILVSIATNHILLIPGIVLASNGGYR